ncbi:hypothetical protein AMAG_06706 [Allomyces macrogynus ATCC 38327]|uniref:HNH nuclease domain-containing protein n=1 Tax=Allomyces macrogynus (strain ATCC 38327) TaxID=578462 RepID=A0A0L0SET1_ALLM3|nr:hypothetical protein AMAG_06706 [Allomyces macrogynus ATCC 38327]|eukprot:KNE60944.1 hypothetical protein AMAG_06706 [Allomyces macrogynus ATCC 38327]
MPNHVFWKGRVVDLDTGRIFKEEDNGQLRELVPSSRGGARPYQRVRLNGAWQGVHRLVVEARLQRNLDQDEVVNHRNWDVTDNRLDNLELVTPQQNSQWRRVSRNSASGHLGVYFHVGHDKWRAHIRVDGRQKHHGYHDSLESAVQARAEAVLDENARGHHYHA